MTFAVCLSSFSHSIFGLSWHIPSREVNRYLKFRSLSLKEINSGFRWFSCLSTYDSWRAVSVNWPSSLSSPSGLPACPWAESGSLRLYNSYRMAFWLILLSAHLGRMVSCFKSISQVKLGADDWWNIWPEWPLSRKMWSHKTFFWTPLKLFFQESKNNRVYSLFSVMLLQNQICGLYKSYNTLETVL